MRNLISTLLLACLMPSLYSQWQQVETPKGVSVNYLNSVNGNLFVCTNDAVYKLKDDNWVKTSSTSDEAHKITSHNGFLFLASSYGIHRSSTNGESWIYASNGLTSKDIWDVAGYKDYVLAGTTNGLFISSDDGANWADSTNDLTSKNINCISVINDTILLGTTKGLFMSGDTCSSWNAISNGITDENVTSIINYKGNLLVSTANGVFLSKDRTKSWTKEVDNLKSLNVNTLHIFNDTIFAGTENGLYYATNFPDIIWHENTLILKEKNIKSLCSYNNELLLGDKLGVRKRRDEFMEITKGFPDWHIYNVKNLDSTIFIDTKIGHFKYNNSCDRWNYFTDFPGDNFSKIIKHNDTTHICYNETGVYASYDTLSSWTLLKTQSDITGLIKLDTLLYMGTPLGGIYRSKDNGITWSQANLGLSAFNVDFIAAIDTILYASVGEILHKSYTKGNEWEKLKVKSSKLVKTNDGFITYEGYKTGYVEDDSLIWNEPSLFINFKDEHEQYVSINYLVNVGDEGQLLYARGCGYYLSQDTMKTWLPVNKGIKEYHSTSDSRRDWAGPSQIFSIGSVVYNNTHAGLFKRDFKNYTPPAQPKNCTGSTSSSTVSFKWTEMESSTVFFSIKDNFYGYDTTFYKVASIAGANKSFAGFGSNVGYEDYFMATLDSGDVSQYVSLKDVASGIEPLAVDLSANLKVYPTIVENNITIESSKIIQNANILITDMSGKNIICEPLNLTEGKKVFNLSSLKRGIYLLQLNTADTKECVKIIKQ